MAAVCGAGHGERSPDRENQRNGDRPRQWDTRAGTIGLNIPKLRKGSYFPTFLEPRRTAERALMALAIVARTNGATRLAPRGLHPRRLHPRWRRSGPCHARGKADGPVQRSQRGGHDRRPVNERRRQRGSMWTPVPKPSGGALPRPARRVRATERGLDDEGGRDEDPPSTVSPALRRRSACLRSTSSGSRWRSISPRSGRC